MAAGQVVSERFYHYDADGNGYLDEKEVGKLAEDLHKAFHPGAAALTAKEVGEMSAVLMERIDGKGGDGNGRVEFAEFAVWYQSVLDKHRAFMARSKPVVEKPKRVGCSF